VKAADLTGQMLTFRIRQKLEAVGHRRQQVSGITRTSAMTVMKFVSPTSGHDMNEGRPPTPAALLRFIPILNPVERICERTFVQRFKVAKRPSILAYRSGVETDVGTYEHMSVTADSGSTLQRMRDL
jgi:hypothetical protein